MPWKDRYTISDERSMPGAALRWPCGARCCVTITVDLSVARGPQGIGPDDLKTPEAFFALNDGLETLVSVLSRHACTATFAVPAVLAPVLKDRLAALREQGHEIAAHGFRHEDVSALSREDEAARIEAATEIITQATGARPHGWYSLPRKTDSFANGTVSPNTIDLLIDAGYSWFGNGLADDIPHWWVTDAASRRALLALPYYYHFDDRFFALFPTKGTGLENTDFLARNWRAEFDAQYARGRFFAMTLTPLGSGFANRAEALDRFLGHMRAMPNIWNPTSSECAAHWVGAFPKDEYLKLEPSIWVDYPGSLN